MNDSHALLPLMIEEALTYDDLLLVPGASCVLPNETNISTQISKQIKLNLPFISAAMDTVSESDMAIALARQGGLSIIHRNLSVVDQVKEVSIVKRSANGIIKNPITLQPEKKIHEALGLMREYAISSFPVINSSGKVIGIVTNRDLRFVENDQRTISSLMSKPVISIPENLSLKQIKNVFKEKKIEKLPVVSPSGKLRGLVCLKDIINDANYPLATKDSDGRLRVGAACGIGENEMARVEKLIQSYVDIIVVDTAHGHQEKVLNMVRQIKHAFPKTEVMGGNVATAEGYRALVEAGADSVKVGIGAGSICTTRVVTGVGVPQATALMNVQKACQELKVPFIADGGIRFSGDIAKALALGSAGVMMGSILAGVEEAPGELFLYHGISYKSYRGMGSLAAMKQGSRARYFQADNKDSKKLIPEGIEGSVPLKGPVADVLYQMAGGLRSAMGYIDAATLAELIKKAKFLKSSHASLKESHIHDVDMRKEAPNYHI